MEEAAEGMGQEGAVVSVGAAGRARLVQCAGGVHSRAGQPENERRGTERIPADGSISKAVGADSFSAAGKAVGRDGNALLRQLTVRDKSSRLAEPSVD